MNKAALFRRWRRLRVYVIPCLVAAAVCLPALFGEKWISDTGMYTAISLKAVREGHWWTLWLSSGPYFNKPPLPFWIHAAVLKLFGTHTWSIKLPEYLAVIGCVLLTVRLARMWSPPRTAMLAGVILACTTQFVLLVDSFRLDYLHTLWLLGAAVCVAKGVKRFELGQPERLRNPDLGDADIAQIRRPRQLDHARSSAAWIVASGVPIGCALMTKPLWGLIVYAVLAAWVAVAGGKRCTRRLVPWLLCAAVLAVLIALPWHVSMQLLHGDVFWKTYFQRQIVERAQGEMGPQAGWHWYFKFLSETYWPWLPFVILAAAWSLVGKPISRDRVGTTLAWTWVLGMLVLLSVFPGKNRYYIYHLYPMLAWLGAMAFGQVVKPRWRKMLDVGVLVPAAIGLLIGISLHVNVDDLPRHIAIDVLGRPAPDLAVLYTLVLVSLVVWRWWRFIERRALGFAAIALFVVAVAIVPGHETREHPLPNPWPKLHAWVREHVGAGDGKIPAERLYNGSVKYNMNARIYVMEGVWPVTGSWNNSPPPEPATEDGPVWLVFDTSNGQTRNRPKKSDAVVFKAGQLVVVKRGNAQPSAD